jgi:hypothetical protein
MTILDVILCFNDDHNKIDFNISNRVQANMEELEVPTNKNFEETLGFLKTILARYHHDMKHMDVLTIFIAILDYGLK